MDVISNESTDLQSDKLVVQVVNIEGIKQILKRQFRETRLLAFLQKIICFVICDTELYK